MYSITQSRVRSLRFAAVLLAFAGAAACGIDKQVAPALTGPSEFAMSITLTATPDQLPRDGSSVSEITVLVREVLRSGQNQPKNGQLLSVFTNAGTLSQSQVVTGADGSAKFSFQAPSQAEAVSGDTVVIRVFPVGTDLNNASARSISIGLICLSNTGVPSPSFTVTPAAPTVKENVILDASATTDEGSTCRDACTYFWDLGGEGATARGRIVNHQFQTVKTYSVRLTVTDAAGSSATTSQNVTVSQGTAPTASFQFSPTSPGQFETVNFTAEASRVGQAGRTISTYAWNFGDGSTATSVTTTHKFNVLGTFPVTLTVTDSAGIQGTTTTNVIVVSGVTADFTMSPTSPKINQAVILNAEASKGGTEFGSRNPIKKYIWNFGVTTETKEEGPITSVTWTSGGNTQTGFPEAKTYTINLTVEDSAGRRATTSKTITVTATSTVSVVAP